MYRLPSELHSPVAWGRRPPGQELHPLQLLRLRNRGSAVDRKRLPEQIAGGRTAKLARLEAALFVAETALSPRRLAQDAALADPGEAHRLVEDLNAAFDRSGSTFRVERVATGYQLLTRPEFASWLDKVHHRQARLRLSASALETLAIVAYRQPLTRADVEAVRGVQCSDLLKQLMDRGLVRIVGEDDALGRPFLYGTTRTFLELFGLRALDDLPEAAALRPRPAPDAETGQAVEAGLDSPPSEAA